MSNNRSDNLMLINIEDEIETTVLIQNNHRPTIDGDLLLEKKYNGFISGLSGETQLAKKLFRKDNPSLFSSTNSMFKPPQGLKKIKTMNQIDTALTSSAQDIASIKVENHSGKNGGIENSKIEEVRKFLENRTTGAYPSPVKPYQASPKISPQSIFQQTGKLILDSSSVQEFISNKRIY